MAEHHWRNEKPKRTGTETAHGEIRKSEWEARSEYTSKDPHMIRLGEGVKQTKGK